IQRVAEDAPAGDLIEQFWFAHAAQVDRRRHVAVVEARGPDAVLGRIEMEQPAVPHDWRQTDAFKAVERRGLWREALWRRQPRAGNRQLLLSIRQLPAGRDVVAAAALFMQRLDVVTLVCFEMDRLRFLFGILAPFIGSGVGGHEADLLFLLDTR